MTLSKENRDPTTCNLDRGVLRVREGRRLDFGGDEETGPFALTYDQVIHNESLLAGRSTKVLHAASPEWEGVDLVVKIYWPEVGRASEIGFLRKAIKEKKNSTDQ